MLLCRCEKRFYKTGLLGLSVRDVNSYLGQFLHLNERYIHISLACQPWYFLYLGKGNRPNRPRPIYTLENICMLARLMLVAIKDDVRSD
jgi:hypothetical protein